MQPKEGVPLFDPDNEEMVELLDWAQNVVTSLRQDKTHGLVIHVNDWEFNLSGWELWEGSKDVNLIYT